MEGIEKERGERSFKRQMIKWFHSFILDRLTCIHDMIFDLHYMNILITVILAKFWKI